MMTSAPGGGSGKVQSQDFELNLASIIDCFTVLIAFMLASASFLSIGILDAGIAAGGVESTGQTPPSVTLTIEMKKDQSYELKISGKASGTYRAGTPEQLSSQLAQLKSQYSDLSAATLIAEHDVEYKEVVRSMETIRRSMPAVMLGGF